MVFRQKTLFIEPIKPQHNSFIVGDLDRIGERNFELETGPLIIPLDAEPVPELERTPHPLESNQKTHQEETQLEQKQCCQWQQEKADQ